MIHVLDAVFIGTGFALGWIARWVWLDTRPEKRDATADLEAENERLDALLQRLRP